MTMLQTLIVVGPASGLVIAGLTLRRRRHHRRHQTLSKSLLLAAKPDLSTGSTAIDAPQGTPYRVISVDGHTVQIEILRPDGSTARGYTTTAHVRT